MLNYKFTNKIANDICKMCGEKIPRQWSEGGIGAVCKKCAPQRDKLDLVKLGIIRNIEPNSKSFSFEALIDGIWYKCGPACGNWSYIHQNKEGLFSVPVGYWELKELYEKHETDEEFSTYQRALNEFITFNGRKYKKVRPNEIIKEGAIHTFNGSPPSPITNALGETVGYTPKEFSDLRVFYNPYKEPGKCKWCGVETINAINECDTCNQLKHCISGNPIVAKQMLEDLF